MQAANLNKSIKEATERRLRAIKEQAYINECREKGKFSRDLQRGSAKSLFNKKRESIKDTMAKISEVTTRLNQIKQNPLPRRSSQMR